MPSHPMDVHVGKRLRLRRSMLGMSQEALGNAIGVTFQQIQKYERGINRIGSGRLHDFAKLMKVSVAYFYEGFEGTESESHGFAEDAVGFDHEAVDNKDSIAMLRAFNKIRNPQVRKQLINLAKAIESTQGEKAS